MTDPKERAQPDLFSTEPLPDRAHRIKQRTLRAGAVMITIIAMAAFIVPAQFITDKRSQRHADLARELEIMARGRVEVVTAWLDSAADRTEHIVGSELFRMFATEIDLAGGDAAQVLDPESALNDPAAQKSDLDVPMVEQLPFMERVLTDFVVGTDFTAGYLFARNGAAYVASNEATPPSIEQAQLASRAFKTGRRLYGPLRAAPGGPLMDLAVPVQAAQDEAAQGGTVAVMLFTLPADAWLAEALAPQPNALPGESLHLLQRSDGQFFEVRPGTGPLLQAVDTLLLISGGDRLSFARRPALDASAPAFSFGLAVPATDLWIIQELSAASAERAVQHYAAAAKLVSVLGLISVILAFGAFWWWLTNSYNRALAEQFKQFGARSAAQMQLLHQINDTVTEYISLKGRDGRYRYVNPAFARAVGRPQEQVIGLDDSALFGPGTADRLKISDMQIFSGADAVSLEEDIYLQSALRHLQVSKTPFLDEDGSVNGVVTVARDVTELTELQDKKDRAVRQTSATLVMAVELCDPYLSGHSRRVAELSVAVARLYGASAEQIATLETAASLSQIGKLLVPRDLLTKPERLSDSERQVVREHIQHAEFVLRDIDFGLPVLETIRQMHERIDGQGYPHGLKGDKVLLTAQILGLCDWFCARVEARAHRAKISDSEALEILESNPKRYALDLVASLRQAVGLAADDSHQHENASA